MQIDKEKVEKVVAAIDNLAATGNGYTFDEFCREHKLYNDSDRVRVDGIFMCCPFHNDKKPSCLISEEKRIFNCFGCGAHGNYISFVTEYHKELLGEDTSYYKVLNEILRKDSRIQAKAGFSSIYKKEHTSVSGLKPLAFGSFKARQIEIGYPELATMMLQKGCTLQQKRYAIVLMQKGLNANTIKKEVFDMNNENNSTNGTLSNISRQYSMEELSKEE